VGRNFTQYFFFFTCNCFICVHIWSTHIKFSAFISFTNIEMVVYISYTTQKILIKKKKKLHKKCHMYL